MKRRALHPDERGGFRDIARKAPDLDAEIFAFKGFAGFAQGRTHDRFCRIAGDYPFLIAHDFRRQHVDIDHLQPVAGRKDDRAFDDVAQLDRKSVV